jgi:hypothetical protein
VTKDSIKPTSAVNSEAATETSYVQSHSMASQQPEHASYTQSNPTNVYQRDKGGEREVADLERHSSAAAYDNIKLPLNFGMANQNRGSESNNIINSSNNPNQHSALLSTSGNVPLTPTSSDHGSSYPPHSLNAPLSPHALQQQQSSTTASSTTAASSTVYLSNNNTNNSQLTNSIVMRDSESGPFLTNGGGTIASATVVVNDFSLPPQFSHKPPERPSNQSYLAHGSPSLTHSGGEGGGVGGGGGGASNHQPNAVGIGHLHTHFAQMEHRSQRSLTNPIVVDSEHYETIQGMCLLDSLFLNLLCVCKWVAYFQELAFSLMTNARI